MQRTHFILMIVLLLVFFSINSYAALGVSVSPSTWAIGNVASGDIKTAGTNYFTVTNSGTEFERLGIKVGSSAPGGMTPGTTAGADTFVLKYGSTGSWTTLSTTDTTLSSWLIDGDYTQFDLQFQAPTSTNRRDEEQTITVTISAYADAPTALENRTLPSRAPWYSSVIVWIPQFTPEWGGTTGGFWMDKFEASQYGVSNGIARGSWPVNTAADPGTLPAVSIQNKPPWDYTYFKYALKACRNRGSGFHLITSYEWAAAVQYAKIVIGRQIPGCNNTQSSPNDQDSETAGTQYGTDDTTVTNRVLTGSGPVEWSLDGAGNGPYDMNGNVYSFTQGFFIVDGVAYIYDLTKVGNYGSGTASGSTFTIAVCDDLTDPASIPDNNWGTSGYYLLDSSYNVIQITGNTGNVLTLASAPTSGTYAYGIYKNTGTNITTGITSSQRFTSVRSDADLKYYAISATTDATGSINYGYDAIYFTASGTFVALRGGRFNNAGGNPAGGFTLKLVSGFNSSTNVDGFVGAKTR